VGESIKISKSIKNGKKCIWSVKIESLTSFRHKIFFQEKTFNIKIFSFKVCNQFPTPFTHYHSWYPLSSLSFSRSSSTNGLIKRNWHSKRTLSISVAEHKNRCSQINEEIRHDIDYRKLFNPEKVTHTISIFHFA
jgi:hypothetical protein